MPIDRIHLGRTFGPHRACVESGRLRFFAKATGEGSRIFFDDPAVAAQGHPRAVAPPTFAFCLGMDRDNPFEILEALGIELGRVLHGEQSFTYHGLLHAGEVVSITDRIADLTSKRGGALEILRVDSEVSRPDGKVLVQMTQTLIVRAA
jgi:hypothetical protein